ERGLLRREQRRRRRRETGGLGGRRHHLAHPRMIGDQQVREIANGLVLRGLQGELAGLDLELVAARGLRQETRGHQRVVEINRRRWRRWRRRGGTGGERQRTAEQNRQFPHRASP